MSEDLAAQLAELTLTTSHFVNAALETLIARYGGPASCGGQVVSLEHGFSSDVRKEESSYFTRLIGKHGEVLAYVLWAIKGQKLVIEGGDGDVPVCKSKDPV